MNHDLMLNHFIICIERKRFHQRRMTSDFPGSERNNEGSSWRNSISPNTLEHDVADTKMVFSLPNSNRKEESAVQHLHMLSSQFHEKNHNHDQEFERIFAERSVPVTPKTQKNYRLSIRRIMPQSPIHAEHLFQDDEIRNSVRLNMSQVDETPNDRLYRADFSTEQNSSIERGTQCSPKALNASMNSTFHSNFEEIKKKSYENTSFMVKGTNPHGFKTITRIRPTTNNSRGTHRNRVNRHFTYSGDTGQEKISPLPTNVNVPRLHSRQNTAACRTRTKSLNNYCHTSIDYSRNFENANRADMTTILTPQGELKGFNEFLIMSSKRNSLLIQNGVPVVEPFIRDFQASEVQKKQKIRPMTQDKIKLKPKPTPVAAETNADWRTKAGSYVKPVHPVSYNCPDFENKLYLDRI